MKTIFKQQLDISDQQTIELPQGFNILHIAKQNGVPCIWYECDTDNSTVYLDIYCFGTGYRMDDVPPMVYIGTVQIDGYVWHYYRASEWRQLTTNSWLIRGNSCSKEKQKTEPMGEQPPFAGLGKLYFCRAEDKDKEPQPLGEAVALKPGMLTYKDDEPKNEYGAKGYSIGFNATMQEPGRELVELLNRPTLWDVRLEREPGRMPRKMKKAVRARYRRDTKWKRKLASYLGRLCHTLHNAEIVITRDQQDRLSDVLNVEMEIRKAPHGRQRQGGHG